MNVNLHQIRYFINHFFWAKRKGHGVHSPFAYRLCEEVFYNGHHFYDFKALNAIRNGLLVNEDLMEVEDLGAGSKTFRSNTRKIKAIASKGISTQKQSEMLYKLINFLKCTTCLELGTSIGLNTLYLAGANPHAEVISIEGSKNLADFALHLAKKNNTRNIRFIHASFDEVLPGILKDVKSLDLLYVDGNHSFEATLRYFKLALEKKCPESVFIFDDIYWSKGMTEAWKEIKAHPSVTMSIDTFYSGMVFFREEIKEKQELRLYI